MVPTAVLTVPRGMSARARHELYAQMTDYLANGRGRPLVLEEGMTWSYIDPMTGRRLPATFQEYRAQLYGAPSRDWLPALNGGLLAAGLGLVVLIVSAVAR